MIKEEYKDVDIEVIAFEATDIVTASCVVLTIPCELLLYSLSKTTREDIRITPCVFFFVG